MKANCKQIQLVKNGDAKSSFSLIDSFIEAPNEMEVQIEVAHFGLNYADVMARNGLYRDCPPLPAVLGYEVVGTVVAVGKDVSEEIIGKKVVAFTRFGGYSTKVNTRFDGCVVIDDFDEKKALALATQYVTAFYMCEYVTNVHEGEWVLIHAAAGGVGTALIQLLVQKKCNIIAKIGDASKREYLEKLGIKHIVDYSKSDYADEVIRITKGKKIDISFNPVAGSTFKKDSKLLGAGGRLVLFGGSERSNGKFGIFSTLRFVWDMGIQLPIVLMMQSKSVLGVNMLKIADNHPKVLSFCLNKVVERAKEGKIEPVVGAEFSANEISEAHALLESGKSTGKIVVSW